MVMYDYAAARPVPVPDEIRRLLMGAKDVRLKADATGQGPA